MLLVSRFSSINFDDDWKLPFQIQECYLQKFKPSDQPRVQYSLETASALKPFMDINGSVSEINTSEVVVIEDTTIREFVVNLGSVVSRTNVEIFFAESAQGSRELSAIIDVDPDVENTVLIEYTNRRNDFDTVFNPANKFSFRVEGCFLPQEVSFDSETESFRDQRHKSKLLSGFPVEKRTLSIGGGFGVPNWAARLINGIFCLSNVEVDGERMIRVDGGVELSMIHNDYPLYIYKIELEHTEDEEVSDILSLLRVVDSKKKVARSTGDDVRVYNAFAKDLGITDSKMIRELSTIQEIAENFYIEIDDNVSSNTAKATLKVLQQFIFNGWIDQPVRTNDDVKFNSVTSSNGKWEISEDGIINIVKAVVMDAIQSDNFFSGSMGSGFSMMKNDGTGKSYLEIDKIYARVKAIFQSVEIRKLLYSIGNYTYGPAGAKCTKVVETGDVYRCFFTADDGEVAVENTFHIDDLVKCQEFNVKAGVHGVTGNRYYWRRCVGIGTDYIDLSKSDCDADSDIPEVGDDMVTQGNKTDKERQSVIVISVVGEDAPSVTLYDGINDYSLEGKAITRLGGGRVGSFFTGDFILTNGNKVSDEIDKTNQSVNQTIQDMADTINLVKELEQNVGNLQDQIDGVIQTWTGDEVPTLDNYPANEWTTDEERQKHIGDLYYDVNGKAYRFDFRDGVYQWKVITDTGLEEALRKLGEKKRIFTAQPTTDSEYDVGDLWANATSGRYVNDILRCNTAKTKGHPFSLDHWELASKYTDDTKANEAMQNAQEAQEAADAAQAAADKAQGDANTAKDAADAAKAEADAAAADAKDANDRLNYWASDSVISPTEKQAIKNEQAQVRAEKNEIVADSGKYSIATTTYVNAFTAYDAVLTKYSASSPENITIGTDFNSTQTTYYAERTKILGLIADGAKKYVDDISIGMVNLLKGSNVELNKQAYNVGGYSYHAQPKTGKQYTLVVCYTLGTNNSYMCAYEDGGMNNITPSFSKKGDMIVESRTFTFRSTSNPPLMNFFQFPNGTYGSKVHWAVLVEGNKGPNSWIPSIADLDKPLEDYKKVVESEFQKTNEKITLSVSETKTYVDDTVGNIKIGIVNLISRQMMLAWNDKAPNVAVWGQDTDGTFLSINPSQLKYAFNLNDVFDEKIKYKSNTQYVFSIKWKLANSGSGRGLFFRIYYTDGTTYDVSCYNTTIERINYTSTKDKTIQKISVSYGYQIKTCIYAISLIEGNQIPTEIPEAVEDIQDLQTGSTNLIIDRQNIITNGAGYTDYTSYSSELNSKGEREVTVTAIKVANKRYSRYKWLHNNLSEQVYPGFYVFSFDYKTNHGDCSISLDWRNTDHSNNLEFYKFLKNTNGEWRRGWFICDWRTGTTQKRNLFSVNPNCSVVGNYVAYRNIKLVRGNRGWDDSVAPQDIEKDIDAAAEKAAAAQKAADAAKTAADKAQTAADSAKSSADAANSELTKMNNDGYISPSEKSMLKQQQKDIQTEYNDIISQAGKYSIATSSYTTAYNSANSALTKYTATSPTHITVGSDYANISAYYTARQTILNSISTAAKKVADDAQAAADKAQETVDNLQVGGTNIIPRAGFYSSSQYATAEVQTETLFGEKVVKYTKLSLGQPPLVSSSLKLEPGQTYTASIYIKNGTANSASSYGRIMFYNSSAGRSLAGSDLLSPSSEWTQLSVTFTNSKNLTSCAVYAYASPAVGNETYFSCMKVEVGNRATPGYSLSQDSLVKVAMEKTIAGINNEPGKVTVFATKQQYNDQQELISQLDSSITVQAGRIDSVVSDISGLNTRISQTESDIELKVDASGIISAINLSKEGVAIKGDRIEITGQTVFKDSNGNKVNIFGQGDKVLTINNGVFSVDEKGLINASAGKIAGFEIDEDNFRIKANSVVNGESVEMYLSNYKFYMGSSKRSVIMGVLDGGTGYGKNTVLVADSGDIYQQGVVQEGTSSRHCRFYTSDLYLRMMSSHRQQLNGTWCPVVYPLAAGQQYVGDIDSNTNVAINIGKNVGTANYAVVGSWYTTAGGTANNNVLFVVTRKSTTDFTIAVTETKGTKQSVYFMWALFPI